MCINIHTYIGLSPGREEGMEGKGGSSLKDDLQCKLSSSQLYVLAIKSTREKEINNVDTVEK